MAQVMVNFRLDADIKRDMEDACKEMGLTTTAAFKIFATKVGREKKIPFSLEADPFYSEENIARLRQAIADMDAGKGIVRELIEVDDDEIDMA